MLKPRNVIIIILLVFVMLTIADFFIENTAIERSAKEASNIVELASLAALKSATMSDEFFVSGTGASNYYAGGINAHLLGFGPSDFQNLATGSSGLLIDKNGDNNFVQSDDTNIFVYTYGSPSVASSDKRLTTKHLFDKMFANNSGFAGWTKAYLKQAYASGPNQRAKDAATRVVSWSDTLLFNVRLADGSLMPMTIMYRGDTAIPKLLTMGASLFVSQGVIGSDVLFQYLQNHKNTTRNKFDTYSITRLETDYGVPTSFKSALEHIFYGYEGYIGGVSGTALGKVDDSGIGYKLDGEMAQAILEAANYWEYQRNTTVNNNLLWQGATASDVDFYYTPLSLGLTYLDPNVLNVLFRSNMDLLMRAKFLNEDGTFKTDGTNTLYQPKIDHEYFGLKTAAEDEHSGFPADWDSVAVNNGMFYYLRGKPVWNSSYREYVDFDGGTMPTPEIEYMYLQLRKDNVAAIDANPELSHILRIAIDPCATATKLFEEYQLTNANTNADISLSDPGANAEDTEGRVYDLIIAKVTFSADILYTYQTRSLRDMARLWSHSGSSVSGAGASKTSLRDRVGLSVQDSVYQDFWTAHPEWQTELSNSVQDSLFDDCKQFTYTTYFAVTE